MPIRQLSSGRIDEPDLHNVDPGDVLATEGDEDYMLSSHHHKSVKLPEIMGIGKSPIQKPPQHK